MASSSQTLWENPFRRHQSDLSSADGRRYPGIYGRNWRQCHCIQTLGEGKPEKANQYFSLLVYATLAFSILISVVGFIFIRPIAIVLGADGVLLDDCVLYARILFCSMPAFILHTISKLFHCRRKARSKLKTEYHRWFDQCRAGLSSYRSLSLWACRSGSRHCRRTIDRRHFPILLRKKKRQPLRLTKAKFNGRVLASACANGSSEMVTNLSASVVSILYNFQLMSIAGENGVAAYGVIMYVSFAFVAIYIGYSMGVAPIIGFNYGAENKSELQNIFRKKRYYSWNYKHNNVCYG